jgi:hypothetical protein
MPEDILKVTREVYADSKDIELPNPCLIKIGGLILSVSVESAKPQDKTESQHNS